MGNAWTIRRARVPRPPVCKSKDPYEKWPLVVTLHVQWFTDDGGGMNFSFFVGDVEGVRIKKTNSYSAVIIDDQGRVWTTTAVIPRDNPLGQPNVASFVAVPIDPAFIPIHGRTNAWNGDLPFQSLEGDLRDFPTRVVGTWSYTFQNQ